MTIKIKTQKVKNLGKQNFTISPFKKNLNTRPETFFIVDLIRFFFFVLSILFWGSKIFDFLYQKLLHFYEYWCDVLNLVKFSVRVDIFRLRGENVNSHRKLAEIQKSAPV